MTDDDKVYARGQYLTGHLKMKHQVTSTTSRQGSIKFTKSVREKYLVVKRGREHHGCFERI